METKGSFSSEFSASVIVAGLWQPEVARPGNFDQFLRFLEKRPLMVKFLKFRSKGLRGDTDWRCCVKCCKICPTGNRWNRALFTLQKRQNFGCLSNCRCCEDRAQNVPGPALNIWLTLFQISPKLVHFWQSYSRTHQHRSLARYYLQNANIPTSRVCDTSRGLTLLVFHHVFGVIL